MKSNLVLLANFLLQCNIKHQPLKLDVSQMLKNYLHKERKLIPKSLSLLSLSFPLLSAMSLSPSIFSQYKIAQLSPKMISAICLTGHSVPAVQASLCYFVKPILDLEYLSDHPEIFPFSVSTNVDTSKRAQGGT